MPNLFIRLQQSRMEVKSLLFAWCGIHKFTPPAYNTKMLPPLQQLLKPEENSKKKKNSGQSTPVFESEVKIQILDNVFRSNGFGISKKLSQTEAAQNMCQMLKDAGYDVNESALPHVIRKTSTPSANHFLKRKERSGEFAEPDNEKRFKGQPVERSDSSAEEEEGEIISLNGGSTASVSPEPDVEVIEFTKPQPEVITLNDSHVSNASSAGDDVTILDNPSSSDDSDRSKSSTTLVVSPLHLHNLSKIKVQKLTDDLWTHYFNVKQTEHVFQQKYALLNTLNQLLQRFYSPRAYLYMFGSSITGLGSYNSDLDLCFVVDPTHSEEMHMDERRFATNVLRRVRSILYAFYSHSRNGYCDAIQLIPARVPILKLVNVRFQDLSFEVDINVNNTAGVRNSHLLHYYNLIDERFAALVLAVKHWAIKADIAAPVHGTLSGLSLTLMVLHYLQRRTSDDSPAVLPNLQYILPTYFNRYMHLNNLKVFDDSILPQNLRPSPNKQSLAELLLGFFDYYAHRVPFEEMAVSISAGPFGGQLKPRSSLPREPNRRSRNDCLIYVEEPYDQTNCARCVFEPDNFYKIKVAFEEAAENLSKEMTLESIGIEF